VRPFHFAVCGDASTAEGWRDLSRRAEDLGYSTLFVADHLDLPAGNVGYPDQHLAAVPAMMAAAAWTTTLEVGARVLCTDYHWPPMLAKEAATIDLLSNGRLLLGLGCGWHGEEYERTGITFDEAPRRVAKLEEVVELVKAHATGEPIDVQGEHVRVHGFRGLPEPVAGRHPKLMIGGSRKRVMSLAGRDADVVSLSNVISADADPAVDIPRQLGFVRDAAGERFTEIDVELMATYVEVTDDVDGALGRVAERFGVEPSRLRDHPLVLVGSVEAIADQIERRRADHGVNYATVPHHFLEAMAPVIERLAGS
jgi:probable F420-dependent oxidoreductase